MKTALFPFVVLIHAFSVLLGMASLSFVSLRWRGVTKVNPIRF
jgi:hypothetical protein